MATGQIEYPVLPSNWDATYRAVCGDVANSRVGTNGYLWVGRFAATIVDPATGAQKRIMVRDSLGLYASTSDFEAHKNAEVRSREKLMRSQFAEQNIPVVKIELASVDRIAVPSDVGTGANVSPQQPAPAPTKEEPQFVIVRP